MEGDEFGLQLRLNLHPAGLKADYLIASCDGSVSRRTSIDVLDTRAAELKIVDRGEGAGGERGWSS